MAHLGQCTHQATSHLSCLDLERAQNVQTNCVCAFAEHPRTSVAQTCDVYETQGPLGTVPLQSTLEPDLKMPAITSFLLRMCMLPYLSKGKFYSFPLGYLWKKQHSEISESKLYEDWQFYFLLAGSPQLCKKCKHPEATML